MELDLEEVYNLVDNEIKVAYKDACINPATGYKQEVIITEDGKLYLSGRIKYDNTIANLWRDNELVLYNLDCSNKIDEKIVTLEDLQCMDLDDYEKLTTYIYKNYPESIDDYHDEILLGDNIEQIFYIDIDLDNIFREVFPETFRRMIEGCIRKNWKSFKRQEILDTIMKCINDNNLLGDNYGY